MAATSRWLSRLPGHGVAATVGRAAAAVAAVAAAAPDAWRRGRHAGAAEAVAGCAAAAGPCE